MNNAAPPPPACFVCGEPASQECDNCHRADYCSQSCQVEASKQHKYTCSTNVEIRRSEVGDGMGLFALKDFSVGDEIIREKPRVVMDNLVMASYIGESRAAAMARTSSKAARETTHLVEAMPFAGRNVVMDLHDAYTDPPSPWGISQTNAIPLGYTANGSAQRSGLFALSCRINHACRGAENAGWVWRDDLECELVFAQRSIAVGDEIVVTYHGAYMSLSERCVKLHTDFEITCSCSRCANSSNESDEMMQEIQYLIDEVPILARHGEDALALRMSERVLMLMKQEGLDTPCDKGCIHYDAYQMAMRSDNIRKARKHICKAWECAKQTGGDHSPPADKYAILMHELEIYSSDEESDEDEDIDV